MVKLLKIDPSRHLSLSIGTLCKKYIATPSNGFIFIMSECKWPKNTIGKGHALGGLTCKKKLNNRCLHR
jgi:hypothetical protein